MQVQVRTDSNINGSAKMIEGVEAELTDALSRFGNQITRVEVYFRDVNGPKSAGDDKCCLLEVRVAGRQPVIVSHEGTSLRQAIDGAIEKLQHSLEHQLGKLSDRRGRAPYSGSETR